jgi:exodeoxyribonuclease VII small subunit
MASRKKTSDDGSPSAGEPTFESALAELEEIVAAMEEEQLPLEDLVARYEKGSKLLAQCETVLASARTRLLTISARAEADARGPAATEDDDPPGLPDDHDDDDDIRLF